MNFTDTPEEAAFRKEVRQWLDENAPWHLFEELGKANIPGAPHLDSEDPVAAAKAWQLKKHEAGYACPTWPKEYGGADMSPIQRVIWMQEEGIFKQLGLMLSIGATICGPTVMEWASQEFKDRLLPKIASGKEVWVQLFSEPAAGSDLAGLRTSAQPADDGSGDWIINGQKIWSSYAHHADWGLLLTRNDPSVAKHKGLTMFVLDMKTPGIEVRPIRMINGQSVFNEVFFNDVRIPDSCRLGPVNEGWKVSLTTLMNERLSISSSFEIGFEQIFQLAKQLDALDDPALRSKLAQWYTVTSGLKYSYMRSVSALSRGEAPGPENSIGKLVAARTRQEISMCGVNLQAQAGALSDPESVSLNSWFQANLMRSPGMRIEGGSDEIQLNIIAERVLGLPGEIRVDKGIPFSEIPTSAKR